MTSSSGNFTLIRGRLSKALRKLRTSFCRILAAYYGQLIRSRNSNLCAKPPSSRASTPADEFYICSAQSEAGARRQAAPLPNKFTRRQLYLPVSITLLCTAATYNFQAANNVYLLRACAHKSRAFCAFRLFCSAAE